MISKYLITTIIIIIFLIYLYKKYSNNIEKYTMTGYTVIAGKKSIDMKIPRINLKNQKERECFQHNVEMDFLVGKQVIERKRANKILSSIGCVNQKKVEGGTLPLLKEEATKEEVAKEEATKEEVSQE